MPLERRIAYLSSFKFRRNGMKKSVSGRAGTKQNLPLKKKMENYFVFSYYCINSRCGVSNCEYCMVDESGPYGEILPPRYLSYATDVRLRVSVEIYIEKPRFAWRGVDPSMFQKPFRKT